MYVSGKSVECDKKIIKEQGGDDNLNCTVEFLLKFFC